MDTNSWFWIGTFGMTIGAALIFFIGKQRTPAEQAHSIIHGIVPVIAACIYFAMANGQGSIELQTPHGAAALKTIWYARYIDWTFTTPLLLTGLSLTAMKGLGKRWGVIFGLIASDLVMIGTAIMFAVTADVWTRWMWFLISCIAFLFVYYGIWVQLRAINQSATAEVQASFERNAAILSVLWLLYPLILAAGTDGLALISPLLTGALLAGLDLTAKVFYGVISVAESTKIADQDLAQTQS